MAIQQEIEEILKNEVKKISTDVIGSAVVYMSGFVLASNLSTEYDADLIAGVVSTFVGSAGVLSDELLREPFEQIHLKSAGNYIILNFINEELVLVLITTDKIKVGLVLYWLKERILPKLKLILDKK